LPLVAQAAAENPTVAAFQTALCIIHTDLEQPEEGRAVIRGLAADDFAVIQYDFLWLVAMCNCAELSAFLGDRSTAGVLLERLLPFHDQFVASVVSVGAVGHFIGALAATLERYEEADAYFAQAAAMEERNGAVTCLARTRLDWARMLLARAAPSDADRAKALLDEVLTTADTVGLPTIERRARELLSR
jgi:hypothetical protein